MTFRIRLHSCESFSFKYSHSQQQKIVTCLQTKHFASRVMFFILMKLYYLQQSQKIYFERVSIYVPNRAEHVSKITESRKKITEPTSHPLRKKNHNQIAKPRIKNPTTHMITINSINPTSPTNTHTRATFTPSNTLHPHSSHPEKPRRLSRDAQAYRASRSR